MKRERESSGNAKVNRLRIQTANTDLMVECIVDDDDNDDNVGECEREQ